MTRTKPKPVWNVDRLVADMALRRMNSVALARVAGVNARTVDRFLSGEVQTSKTAGKLADALGYSVRRYLSHVEAVA